MTVMPVFNVDMLCEGLTDQEVWVIRAAFTNRGVKNKSEGYAKLRSNKPFRRVETFEQGCANYVWRMLCFDLVGSGKHACMPVCSNFETSDAIRCRDGDGPKLDVDDPVKYAAWKEYRDRGRVLMKELDELIKRVETKIPLEEKRGLVRWGYALGVLG